MNAYTDGFETLSDALDKGNGDIPDGYYKYIADASFGCFATMTKNGSVDKAYYAVWLSDGSVAAVSVAKDADMERFDQITEDTWKYVNGEAADLTNELFEKLVEVHRFMENYLPFTTRFVDCNCY